ncbi:hypothetical protein MFERI13461_00305 [Mycoplasma feriruminatoris]|uniref:MSC_0624 family F1-like ATPase-associated membrane protein n=1 Tax=Mycoplasma feriruminatoris TaxID=1179777 RepID=UPI00241FFABE|nr:hypothetical protein [Mycoplasma feriruminatoris]WFQ90880.1 hypothetical protein MFERI13461_00305 [Mycoplasma feriruminatoris]WFQ91701.1 hypothetical protein MFERI14815_00305 [Mycoplasma feriruminatoris]
MISLKVEQQKFYDDGSNLILETKKNKIVSIYKTIILSFFFVSMSLLIFLSDYSIFNKNIQNSYQFLFNFSQPLFEQYNWVVLFRISLLGFLYFYSLRKAYINIELNKPYLKKYTIWFSLYFITSIIAFVLFFTYSPLEAQNVINLIYSLIGLLLIDVSYVLFKYKTRKKLNPLVYQNKWSLIVDLISRIVLVSLVVSIFLIWVNQGGEGYEMLVNNKFYEYVLNLFRIKSFTNFLIIITSFIFVGLLFTGLKIYTILQIVYKQYSFEVIRDKLNLYLTGVIVVFIWLTSLVFLKIPPTHEVFVQNDSLEYLYLLFSLLNIIITVVYLWFKQFKNKLNSPLIKISYLTIFHFIIWTIFMIATFLTTNTKVGIINLLITIILVAISYYWHIKSSRFNNYYNYLLITLNIIMIFIISLIFGFNQILLSHNNKNLFIIPLKANLLQVISIFIVAFQIINVIYPLTYMLVTSIRILKTNQKEKKYETQKQTK